jgi:hypothetical protein
LTDLKRISELIGVARIIVDEDNWGGDHGHEPLTKSAIEALFRAWEEQAVADVADTKASQAEAGEEAGKMPAPLKFSTEDKQVVLLIASAIHDEIRRSHAGTFYRSQKRARNMERFAVAMASKRRKPHTYNPNKLEFNVEDAISRSSNVTRMNSFRSLVNRVKAGHPDRNA